MWSEYYAQVTAPLRRLADRYATEIVLSLVAETQTSSLKLLEEGTLPRDVNHLRVRKGNFGSSWRAALDRDSWSCGTGVMREEEATDTALRRS